MPKGILLDLDDTILDDSGGVETSWWAICGEAALRQPVLEPRRLYEAISRQRSWFWADAERHRTGRMNLREASRTIVHAALCELGVDAPELAAILADDYRNLRDERLCLIPGAIDAMKRLRTHGARLALITNGSASAQRRKIDRFELARFFDQILIEGEVGIGKPDPRVYQDAVGALGCGPAEAWSVGDNLEWDVTAPQRLGVYAIWVDARGAGLPPGLHTRPDRIIRSIAELP